MAKAHTIRAAGRVGPALSGKVKVAGRGVVPPACVVHPIRQKVLGGSGAGERKAEAFVDGPEVGEIEAGKRLAVDLKSGPGVFRKQVPEARWLSIETDALASSAAWPGRTAARHHVDRAGCGRAGNLRRACARPRCARCC